MKYYNIDRSLLLFDVKTVSRTAYRREQFTLNQGSSSACVDQMPETEKKWWADGGNLCTSCQRAVA